MEKNKSVQKIQTFKALHESGCFIIPNPWDIGSAKFLESRGFKALATTSAGFAFSKGFQDSVSAIPRDIMLEHIKEICSSTSLPVNADFQNGYAIEPDKVAENVKLCVGTGVAGLSIEDATGDKAAPLYERELAIERIKAARSAIDSQDLPVVLTARCEAWLVGVDNPSKVALDRLTAYAAAGADCLYAPRVNDLKEIEKIVKEVTPKPVNALITDAGRHLTFKQLSEIGVRRISVGATLARVAWYGFIQAINEISEKGTFNYFTNSAPFDVLNNLFEKK
ncbi:MAG: isocitrate lyase/phosphoenolpyruvate mutase family protein [Ignavibacteriae bacterium]|nr:MAG: isocitrate lyase/phosphoenolpyruvate mutase family protein [Ignavibacteriota bacterium]